MNSSVIGSPQIQPTRHQGQDMAAGDVDTLEQVTMRKVAWRLVPLLCLLYVSAFIIRINVGFAALTMGPALGITPTMFGFAGGIFFLSYFVFEVPSNLMLHRFGARIWIARVMITIGIISALFCLVAGPTSFYAMRFLLGAAEAGLFPGLILYLTYWFPKRWRGRMTAGFVVAIPISSFLAGPLSSLILQLDGLGGFAGWQWLFVLEALPAVVLCFVVWRYLTNRPEEATWLTAVQRDWLVRELAKENADIASSNEKAADTGHGLGDVFSSLVSWQVMRLALVYFGLTTGLYGIELWLPQIMKGFGLSNLEVGFVSAIPYVVAVSAMMAWAKRSDRTGDRFGAVAIACAVGFVALIAAAVVHSHSVLTVVTLSIAIAGVMSARPPFWSLPTDFLTGRKAAAGIAAINSIGNLGGFAGPFLIGWARDLTGSFTTGLMISALTLLASTLFILSLRSAAARKVVR